MNRVMIAAVSLLALSACEKTRQQFDFSKDPPDEFAVVRRAPLEIPADMTALPAPRPGAPRPQEVSPFDQARATVLGVPPTTPAQASAGEAALLQQAGAGKAPRDIRAAIDAETDKIAHDETPTFDRIMGLTGKRVIEPAVEVDPVAETNRLKDNKAAGRPITAGETAVKDE